MAGRGGGCRRLPAFWVGLLYDDAALDAAWDLVKDWTAEERQKLRDDVPKLGFKAHIRQWSVLNLAKETLKLAEQGWRAAAGMTGTATTRRAICGRSRNSSRAASPRPRSCWRNSTGHGRARSIRSTKSTLTEAFFHLVELEFVFRAHLRFSVTLRRSPGLFGRASLEGRRPRLLPE